MGRAATVVGLAARTEQARCGPSTFGWSCGTRGDAWRWPEHSGLRDSAAASPPRALRSRGLCRWQPSHPRAAAQAPLALEAAEPSQVFRASRAGLVRHDVDLEMEAVGSKLECIRQ